jgi:hypothetical protein
VRVIASGIDLEFTEHLSTQSRLGEHSANRLLNDTFGVFGEHTADTSLSKAAGVSTVRLDHALLSFASGEHDLFCIGDNDEVATVNMRCPIGAMLPHQHAGDFGRHASKDFPVGIDVVPLGCDLAGLEECGLTGHEWNLHPRHIATDIGSGN